MSSTDRENIEKLLRAKIPAAYWAAVVSANHTLEYPNDVAIPALDSLIDAIMELLTEARSQGRVEELEYIQLCERDNRESGHKWSSGDYKKFIQSELEELTPILKEQDK